MYCTATAADCPFVAKKAQLMKMTKNRQCGPDETSCPAGCCPEPTGSAAPTTCTVLPPLLTVPSLPRRPSSRRWPRTGSADLMRPLAPLAAALRPTGSAALTTCTVLPPLPTVPSLPRRPSS